MKIAMQERTCTVNLLLFWLLVCFAFLLMCAWLVTCFWVVVVEFFV